LKKESSKNGRAQTEAAAAAREERRRIFRELHDRVLQLLSSVRLRAEVCRRELIRDPKALEKELLIIEENTELAVAEIRRLLSESQADTDLVAGTLERRLREEMEIFRSRSGLQLTFHCAIDSHSLPYAVERELYFTLREGVINAVRHSRASELRLSLANDNGSCRASLEDDGTGFDLAATEGGSHYGLRIMRERIEKLGGRFTIETAPGKGTRISITVPTE
jgi:NarL family two-component system sensor histidine kinase LiaS